MLYEQFNYFMPDQMIFFLIKYPEKLKCECFSLGFATLR